MSSVGLTWVLVTFEHTLHACMFQG